MQLLDNGALTAILLLGEPLAFVLGLVLLVLYKRATGRHMRGVAAVAPIGNQDNYARQKPLSPLTYRIEDLDGTQAVAPPVAVSLDATFRSGTIYSAAAGPSASLLLACCLPFRIRNFFRSVQRV